jgi:(E)-4-hydroxy-3-methyl-but-2-enyl pyrophosphate reductase
VKVIRAKVCGFCFGVRRAIDLAEKAASDNKIVTTLGSLVHNPQEVSRLKSVGIETVKSVDDIDNGIAIVRAHGARPEIFEELIRKGINIIDATCPVVAKSQKIAQQMENAGYDIVIIGHRDHPEVHGILGYLNKPAIVISTVADVMGLPMEISPGVIAQTTVNENEFHLITTALKNKYQRVCIENTVCRATRDRQEAAREMAKNVDAVFVIGGRESSNTNRLAEVCREICDKTYLIETAEEINIDLICGAKRIGVTAGASTPEWLIDEVVEYLTNIGLNDE